MRILPPLPRKSSSARFSLTGSEKRGREPTSADTIDTMKRRLEMHVFPYIGNTDVAVLAGPDLLSVLPHSVRSLMELVEAFAARIVTLESVKARYALYIRGRVYEKAMRQAAPAQVIGT